MHITDLITKLDTFFQIDRFPPDLPFSKLVPSVYAGTGIDLNEHLTPSFLERFHGLMLHNSDTVNTVHTAVFLSDEIVKNVTARAAQDALLICHHPLVMETSGRGFLPLSPESFAAMQRLGISAYVLHTPLDVHETLCVSGALARELGVKQEARFEQVGDGYAGVYGRLPDMVEFDELLKSVREVTQVPDVHFIANRASVQSIAVLGGGLDADGIWEVEQLGCDALVTGTYMNMVQNEIGRKYREDFERIRDRLTISLIECSHYASEAVVMKKDMIEFCTAQLGVPCEFVPQDDPWY